MKKILVATALSVLVFGGDKLYKPVNGKCKAGHEMITIKSIEPGEDCGHAMTTKGKHILAGCLEEGHGDLVGNDLKLLSYSEDTKKPICTKSKSIMD